MTYIDYTYKNRPAQTTDRRMLKCSENISLMAYRNPLKKDFSKSDLQGGKGKLVSICIQRLAHTNSRITLTFLENIYLMTSTPVMKDFSVYNFHRLVITGIITYYYIFAFVSYVVNI